MNMLNNLTDEMAVHGSGIYEIQQRTKSLEEKFDNIMVSCTHIHG